MDDPSNCGRRAAVLCWGGAGEAMIRHKLRVMPGNRQVEDRRDGRRWVSKTVWSLG